MNFTQDDFDVIIDEMDNKIVELNNDPETPHDKMVKINSKWESMTRQEKNEWARKFLFS